MAYVSAQHKETHHKSDREAARRERVQERERRRAASDAGTVTDAPEIAPPPVEPRKPRPTR
ncbi:MAG: hypothetical protein ACLQBX_04695 [Candidatus Limnocylindrales bacterium]